MGARTWCARIQRNISLVKFFMFTVQYQSKTDLSDTSFVLRSVFIPSATISSALKVQENSELHRGFGFVQYDKATGSDLPTRGMSGSRSNLSGSSEN